MFGLNVNQDPSYIDIPFECRHQCWFCGEPAQMGFCFPQIFPQQDAIILDCPHPQFLVPSCAECHHFAQQAKGDSIWAISLAVKRKLLVFYQKDLAIGINWTEQELDNSQFEGGNFSGFQKSAWFVFQVAKDRINFSAWPLSYQGVDIDVVLDKKSFSFDGVTYPSIDDAVEHYCQTFALKKNLFQEALNKIGIKRFSDTVRFCRLLVGATPNEQKASLSCLF